MISMSQRLLLLLMLGALFGVTSCATTPPTRRDYRRQPETQGSKGRNLPPRATPVPTPSPTPMPAPLEQEINAQGSGSSRLVTPADENSTQKEKDAYRDLISLFTSQAYEAVILHSQDFEARYPQSKLLSAVHNVLGLVYLLQHQTLQAQHYFKRALASPDHRFKQFVLYNYAASLVDTQNFIESLGALDEINPELLDPATRVKFHYLRSQLKVKTGSPLEAVRDLLIGYPLIPLPTGAAQQPQDSQAVLYQKQLEMSVKEVKDYTSLEVLLREHPNHALTPYLLYRMAETAADTGRSGLAEAHLRSILNQYPDSNVADAAKDMLRSLRSSSNVSGRSVGILLPLSGKFSKFGGQARQAIELAFEGKSDSLVFEDSGDSAEQALQALDRLIVDKHVVAVIGPLLSKGIEQLSQRAQELGVPILTLAQQAGISGDYVFRAAVSPKQQVNEMAAYAVNDLGFKKFAIIYPQGRFGQEYADSFWDAVEALGGEVTEIESYPSKETDFREAVDRSVSLYYKDARGRELGDLAKSRKEKNIIKKTRKTEEFYDLLPVIDFDAIFIPDEAKIVGQIIPTFQYRDINKVPFLGISAWNSAALLQRLPSKSAPAYFVDVLSLDNPPAEFRSFAERYQQTYNSKPSVLEATAYDAGGLLRSFFKSDSTQISRTDLKDMLTQVKNYPGVTGLMTYSEGEFARTLRVFSAEKGQITEVSRGRKRR